MPQILNANDLPTGDVVYWTGEGWSRDIRAAVPVADTAAAERFAEAEVAARRVVEPYFVDVEATADGPVPVRARERVRALGPSVRPDLGKQADFRTGAKA